MELSRAKVPVIIVSSVISFAVGVAVCALTLVGLGLARNPFAEKPAEVREGEAAAQEGPQGNPMGGGGRGRGPMGPGGGRGPGRGGGGMMGFGRGPTAKDQLAVLVAKLDQLTDKPITLHLNDAQRKKVAEQLQGLEEPKELSDEDAKKRVDALLEVLEDQRTTLEAAGYRWPGEGGGFRRPANAPNPFKEGDNAKHLKSLRDLLKQPSSRV